MDDPAGHEPADGDAAGLTVVDDFERVVVPGGTRLVGLGGNGVGYAFAVAGTVEGCGVGGSVEGAV